MKQLKLLIFLSLLSACGVDQEKSDADVELDEMIVGQWSYRVNVEFDGEESSLQWFFLYDFDESGDYTLKAGTLTEDKTDDEVAYAIKTSGEWELYDDELTMIQEASFVFGERVEKSDTIYKNKIISINENKMVWKSNGKKQTLKRVE